MHVIVGQGQLDSILQATPEGRRGFIEEAAGVLKHRKRKEKALRKLEACEGNLNRLEDLISEIRRQLKPLGRQAEVARKAAVIQAEVRDAKARLIADDLVQASLAMDSDLADERAMKQRRVELEEALERARAAETEAEQAVRGLRAAAERRPGDLVLTGRAEGAGRLDHASIARERMRNADDDPARPRVGRDPTSWTAEAETVAARRPSSRRGRAPVSGAGRGDACADQAEQAHQREEARLAALLRAAADRREGLARLTGQVNSLRSRAEAADGRDRAVDRGARRSGGAGRAGARAFTDAGDQGGRPGRR